MPAAEHQREAADEVQRAGVAILCRAGASHDVAVRAMRHIHQAYTGRGWRPPPELPTYCANHPSTKMPCKLCRAEGS